jgi:hypothetical protein
MLTDRYGPRLTGPPNFEAAARWVATQLTQWGKPETLEGACEQNRQSADLRTCLGMAYAMN